MQKILSTEIFIRLLRLEDLQSVMNIEPLAFGPNHWSKQIFINELNGTASNYFVAIETTSKQLVGYTGFWLIGQEGHITTLATHPDYRRQHIAERLLINNIVHAHKLGAHWLTLEVRASNEAAQNLYYKYNFKNIGVRTNYYQDNLESAFILWSDNIATAEFQKLLSDRLSALQESQGVA